MRLALFFTTGISLEIWNNNGSLQRELSLYRLLSSDIEKIFLFTYGSKVDLKFQDELPNNITIQYKRWPIPNKFYSFLLPFLYFRVLRDIDIYKTNQMSGSWTAVIAKFLYRKKLIVRCGYELLSFSEKQNIPWPKKIMITFVEYLAYHTANAIIVASEVDKSFIEKRFGNKEKITCLQNYVDTDIFKQLSVIKDAKKIIFVGRFTEQKNLFNLLEACVGIDLKLVLIGSGPLEKKLREASSRLKINVEFKGNINSTQLPKELNIASVFILPSLYEGSPKSLLEAMACGLPCIGTNVEGIYSIIHHKENGYLCNTSITSLRQAILCVLENEKLRSQLGEGARKTIEENFCLKKYAERESKIYNTL